MRTIYLSYPHGEFCLIQKIFFWKRVAIDKDNPSITSSESKYLRTLYYRGKRRNSRGPARHDRRGQRPLAIDKYRHHPGLRRGREIEMLRVADMHRVIGVQAGARKRELEHLAPRRGIAGLGRNGDRGEMTGKIESVENAIKPVIEVGDHAQLDSSFL